jgi:transcriptional regulator with XRE-family HTH domain
MSLLQPSYTPYQQISLRLNHLMYINHITQRELGLRLGLTQGGFSKKKIGASRWNLDEVFRLAEVFNVSVGYMVGEEPLEAAMAVNAKTAEESSTVSIGSVAEPEGRLRESNSRPIHYE